VKHLNKKLPHHGNRYQLLFIVSAALFLFSIFYNFTPSQIAITSDAGLTFAVADHSLSGHLPLLGAPSHTGGRHLGPLYYYLTAILYFLSGKNIFVAHFLYSCFLVSGICLWLLFFWKISLSLANDHKRFFYLCSAVFLSSLITKPSIELFRYFWQPHFFLFFTPLLLHSLIGVLQKKPGAVLKALITSSFMIQIHYGSLPMLACFWVCFLIARLNNQIVRESDYRYQNASSVFLFALLFLLWAPTIYYEFFIEQNIIRTLIPHISSTTKNIAAEFSLRGFLLTYAQEQNGLLLLLQKLPRLVKLSGFVFIIIVSIQSLLMLRSHKLVLTFFFASLFSFAAFAALLYFSLDTKRTYYLYPLLGVVPALFSLFFSIFLIKIFDHRKWLEGCMCLLIFLFTVYATFDVTSTRSVLSMYSLKKLLTIATFIPKKDREAPLQLVTSKLESPMRGSLQFLIGSAQYPFISDWERLKEFQDKNTAFVPNTFKSVWKFSCNQNSNIASERSGKSMDNDTFRSSRCFLKRLSYVQ
jgi:hypothetical protein